MARFKSFSNRMQSESELLIEEVNKLAQMIQFEAIEKETNICGSAPFDSGFYTTEL